MSRPEDSHRGEPDPLIQQFTDWRNELLDILEWLRTSELNEGNFGSPITAQDLCALLERYDDTIMRLRRGMPR